MKPCRSASIAPRPDRQDDSETISETISWKFLPTRFGGRAAAAGRGLADAPTDGRGRTKLSFWSDLNDIMYKKHIAVPYPWNLGVRRLCDVNRFGSKVRLARDHTRDHTCNGGSTAELPAGEK